MVGLNKTSTSILTSGQQFVTFFIDLLIPFESRHSLRPYVKNTSSFLKSKLEKFRIFFFILFAWNWTHRVPHLHVLKNKRVHKEKGRRLLFYNKTYLTDHGEVVKWGQRHIESTFEIWIEAVKFICCFLLLNFRPRCVKLVNDCTIASIMKPTFFLISYILNQFTVKGFLRTISYSFSSPN